MPAHGGGQGQDNHKEIKLRSNESVPVVCPTSGIFSRINHWIPFFLCSWESAFLLLSMKSPLTNTHMGFTRIFFLKTEMIFYCPQTLQSSPWFPTRFHLFSMGFQPHCNLILSHFPGFLPIIVVPPPNPYHLNLEFITQSPSLYWHSCWLSLLLKVYPHFDIQSPNMYWVSSPMGMACVRCWRHRPEWDMNAALWRGVGLTDGFHTMRWRLL